MVCTMCGQSYNIQKAIRRLYFAAPSKWLEEFSGGERLILYWPLLSASQFISATIFCSLNIEISFPYRSFHLATYNSMEKHAKVICFINKMLLYSQPLGLSQCFVEPIQESLSISLQRIHFKRKHCITACHCRFTSVSRWIFFCSFFFFSSFGRLFESADTGGEETAFYLQIEFSL